MGKEKALDNNGLDRILDILDREELILLVKELKSQVSELKDRVKTLQHESEFNLSISI